MNDRNVLEDVWKRIDKKEEDDCWEWMGFKNQKGYGRMSINKKLHSCHRIVYELIHNSVPKGMLVCHSCDNPSCCNPRHLFLGTNKDNINDMKNKHRQSMGEHRPHHKLTREKVKEIRIKYFNLGYTQKQLGIEYGVTYQTIGCIIRNEKWKCV